MISTTTVISPESAAEAYDAYHSTDSAILVAGAQEINKREGHYDLAIHLRNAGLDYIEDRGDEIAIGAMTTMREIETSSLLKELAGGVIVECLKEFGDTGLKSKATIGGLIALKKPVSLLIPILLALTTDVLLEGKGRMDLNDYLYCPPMGEMIKEVIIQKELVYTTYQVCQSKQGETIHLVGAASMWDDHWRIVMGGRPGLAQIAEKASIVLSDKGTGARENVAHLVSEELEFSSTPDCTEEERRLLAIDVVRRLIKKTWKGFSHLVSVDPKGGIRS